jgi:hypothetical protein
MSVTTLKGFMKGTVDYRPELVPVPVDRRLREQVSAGGGIFVAATVISFIYCFTPASAPLAALVFLVSAAALVAWWVLRAQTRDFTLADPGQLELLSLLGTLATVFRWCGIVLIVITAVITLLIVLLLLGALGAAASSR